MDVSKTITYDNDDQRDDPMYTISKSVRAVHEWKKHILRSVNQDMARKSALENLKEDEVLVERDWAMKFIPMQYRESQSKWFGKRGLNWHVSVATFKYRQDLTMHTVMHIFDSAPQDAETSNAVLEVESLVNDNTVTTGDQSNDDVDSVTAKEMSKLFSCNECIKTFSKYGNLLRHLDIGKHSVKQKNKKLSYKSKIEYSRHMEKVNTVTVNSNNFSSGNSNSDLTQGWALKLRRTVKRFTQDQKNYLQEKFDRGEKTGQKFDPEEVSQDMRFIRTTSGRKRFSQEEFLSPTQIASYFSRLVLNKRKLNNPLYTADEQQAETAEAEFIELN